MIKDWLSTFEWDSDDQRKGYLSFLQWAHSKGLHVSVRPIDLFFIQKDHESHEWWVETVGTHIKGLEHQIKRLSDEVNELKERLEVKRPDLPKGDPLDW